MFIKATGPHFIQASPIPLLLAAYFELRTGLQ